MNKELKNGLLNYGFNINLNHILKKCNEISSSVTGLNKKILDIEREYSVNLFKIDRFDPIRESKKWQLECIEKDCKDLIEIAKELIYINNIIGGEVGSFEDLSDEELRQRIEVVKEKLVEYSSTVLSICNLEGDFLGHLDYCNNSAQTYFLIARLFKMMSALKSCESIDVEGVVSLFWTISIKGKNKNN